MTKIIRRLPAVLSSACLSCVLAAVLISVSGCGSDNNSSEKNKTFRLTILQTSDLHHHASGYGPFLDYTPDDTSDNDGVSGGYARLASLIGQIREEQSTEDIPTLLLDSGDFFMGTVYDFTASDPVGLKFFSLMDYDAVTLGNHEFDWGPDGLALLLSNGVTEGFSVPIIASNMVTSDTETADDGLENFVSTGTIVSKKVIELANGMKVGLLGLMGEAADTLAPAALPVTFNHEYAFIQSCVDDLKNNEGVHLVLVMSHSGVETDGTGEDEDLANGVTGIDIIASGHLHTATHEAFVKGGSDTIIFSPGRYGAYLSRIDITYNKAEESIENYTFSLVSVDDSVEGDDVVAAAVEESHEAMNNDLDVLGITLEEPVSITDFTLETAAFQETGLGNLVSDSIRKIATDLAPLNDGNAYHIGVVASGVIRDKISPGKTGTITFADVYGVLAIGSSPDEAQLFPGYPLMSVYVTAADIRNICDVSLTYAPLIGPDYYLNLSGISFQYNSAGSTAAERVPAVFLWPVDNVSTASDGVSLDFDDENALYHVVVDLYALQLMDFVNSFGINLVARDASGNAIQPEDFLDYRIDAHDDAGVQELKEWMGLLQYLDTYYPETGVGIPSSVYGSGGTAMGRVLID